MNIRLRIKAASLSILAIVLIVITIIALGTARFNTPNDYELVQLDKGWTICRDGAAHPVEALSTASIGLANKDDTISISTIIPSDIDIPQATVQFRSILSTVNVYFDGELVYSYGSEYADNGRMLPKYIHFVPLPKHYQGKTLEIEFTAREDNAFAGFSDVLLGSYKDIANNLLQPNRLSVVIGNFLCVFGFIMFVLSPFLIFNEHHDYSILFSALISLLIGVYIFCFNDLFWYISNQPAIYTFLEYFSLYMIPLCIIGFILTTGQLPSKKSGRVIFAIDFAFVAATILLHVTNLVHICHFVTLFHFSVFCEGIYVIISLVYITLKNHKDPDEPSHKSMSTMMLIAGLISFLFCAMVDIVKFNILKYGKSGEVNATINFTTVGALLFMICLFLNYFYHCIEYISDSTVRHHLEGLAYSDSLTELANRAKCELALAELHGDYTIISPDLDYLKYTNDNYGHSEGDKLLSGFAKILKDSYTDASLIGRMGGDEFIVVLPFIDGERVQRDIDCMVDLMSYRTSKEDHIRFSASWGHANSSERELLNNVSAQNVYLLADSRMYVMKNEHHNQSLGRLYDDLLKNMLKGR